MNRLVLLLVLSAAACSPRFSSRDVARWKREAQNVTITRDDWGIAHVHGTTDADAVFGMEYAQAEDDFNRVETNYLDALGWHAQADGESRICSDLRQRLFVDTDSLKAEYAASPPWLQQLMDAFADGLNYYLYTHPAGEAQGHHALRAVDGAELHRREHRRRHRAREPAVARGVLRRHAGPAAARRRRGRTTRRREPRARTASRSRPATRWTTTRCCGSILTRRSTSAPSSRWRATRGSTPTGP